MLSKLFYFCFKINVIQYEHYIFIYKLLNLSSEWLDNNLRLFREPQYNFWSLDEKV